MRILKASEERKGKAFFIFSLSFFLAACGLSFFVYTLRWQKGLEAAMSLEIQRKGSLEERLRGYKGLKELLLQFPKGEDPMEVLAKGLDRLKGRFSSELALIQGKDGDTKGIAFELRGIGTQEELLEVLTFLESFGFPVLLMDTLELTPFDCKVEYLIKGVLKVPDGKD